MKTSPPLVLAIRKLVALLLAAGGFFLAGCSLYDLALEGNALAVTTIPGADWYRVEKTISDLMAKEGYQRRETGNPQELRFESPRSFLPPDLRLAYEFRNSRTVLILAQPVPDGWRVYALPEPSGTDTYFPLHQMRRVLNKAARALSKS